MGTMRLLVFHPTVAPYRIDFFNALNDSFETKTILWRDRMLTQDFDMEKLYAQLHFKPEFRTERYGIFGLKQRKGILSAMRINHPDVIISSECGPVTLFAIIYKYLFNRKCKVLTMIDDSIEMFTGGKQIKWRHAFAENQMFPFLDNIICVEPAVTKHVRRKYNKGVTMPIIYEDNKAREKYQRLLPLSESIVNKYSLVGKKVCLFVGRLAPEKNISKLIDVFKSIDVNTTKLVIIGTGALEEELKNKAADSNNIILTGRLEGDEVYAWYNVAHIFVLPSTLEPFGAVTNEALLAGCYSLISSKAGSSYLVSEGVNGSIIDPYDENDIREKLINAIDNVHPLSLPLPLKPNNMSFSFHECFNKMMEEAF